MHDVLRFWLDRGVDGFRADVIHCIGKDPALPDDPEAVAGIPHCALNDVPVTHERLRDIRHLVDGYPGDPVVVGEVYLLSTPAVATYYGDGDELHLAFNFPPLYAPWLPDAWTECITGTVTAFDERDAWPTWVLSNHDNPRHRTRYDRGAERAGEEATARAGRSEARARAAAVLLLTLRGTPFHYQGEELGLLDAVVSADQAVDPGGRDGCRAPLPWDGNSDHGWPVADGSGPWLPFAPEVTTRNYAAQRDDSTSILHLYRRMIALRHRLTPLSSGRFELLEQPEGLVGYRRTAGDDTCIVLVNFTDREVSPDLAGAAPWTVALASDGGGESTAFSGALGPDQAVVLIPSTGEATDQSQISRQ
jgi:alpha-glucosidase